MKTHGFLRFWLLVPAALLFIAVLAWLLGHPSLGGIGAAAMVPALFFGSRLNREMCRLGQAMAESTQRGQRAEEGRRQAETRLSQLEQSAEQTQAVLQATVDALNAHVAILDERGCILSVNAAWRQCAEANGLAGHEFVGASYLGVCDAARGPNAGEARTVAAGIRKVLSGVRDQFYLEYPCHGPAEERWFGVRVTRVAGDGPCRAVVVHENLTLRFAAEQLVRGSEERYRGLVESSFDLILSLWPDGRLRFVNRAWRQHLGYAEGEVAGLRLEQILAPGSADADQGAFTRACAGEPIQQCRAVFLTKGGAEVLVEGNLTPKLEGGRVLAVHGFFRDITDRVRAEEQLRQQAALLDLTPDAILVEDNAGQVIFWNQGAEQTYGWRRDEVLGRPSREFLRVPPCDGEQRQRTDEARQLRKDGTEIVVQTRQTLVRDAAGQALARLIVNTDVTEQKQLEKKFLRAQRMESLGALAGGIAHDLNNVLTPLAMGLPMLAGRLPEGDSGRGMLQTMEACVERGAGMVKQILTFVRGQEGEKRNVELSPLLREVGKLTASSFPRSIAVQTEVARDLWPVVGDLTQLYQALMNLVVNARDAMPYGGKLSLVAENSPGGGPDGIDVLRLRVRDTGTGIPPELLGRIFEPFFTTKRPGQGTGLGLATAAEIIRGHGGALTVSSEVGRGSEFVVLLPAVVVRPASKDKLELPLGNGELILIVDDKRSVRELARAILETYGYRTLLAADAGRALSLCKEQAGAIRLALVDYQLPDLDGASLCRSLREQAPALRVLLTSGSMPEASRPSGVAFVAKPFTASRLLQAIQEALA